jgi:hypothetical protein
MEKGIKDLVEELWDAKELGISVYHTKIVSTFGIISFWGY